MRARLSSYAERTAIWIPIIVIGLLMMPLVVTHRTFGHDWTLHLWAIRQQQWNIEAMGHPGLFISAKPLGAFYPIFAFVGSGIYSVGGYLAIVLGPIVAYKVLYLLGLCLAYGGFTWISVQFGLVGWRSQVPGAVLVTGAYYVTDMVGRGDFAEFIAVASIPFVIAAACAVLTSPIGSPGRRLAVVVAVFVLTGSHNITLLWGSVLIALLGLLAVVAWGPTWRRPLPWRRVAQLIGLGAIGAGLNAWYLIPDLAYALDTTVARQSEGALPGTPHVGLALLLNPLRPDLHVTGFFSAFSGDFRLSMPVLFLAWVLAVAVVMWRGQDWVSKRLFVTLLIVLVALARLSVSPASWKRLPHILYNIQFTYRLDSYVLLTTALLVTIALRWQTSARDPLKRRAGVLLAVILVFNVGAATWQVWNVKSRYVSRVGVRVPTGAAFARKVVRAHYVIPPSWYGQGDFRDTSTPVVAAAVGRTMTLPLNQVRGSSFSGTLDVPNGRSPFNTNISSGTRFVRMTGIRAVGRSPDGFVVATRAAGSPAAGPVAVTIRQADSAPLRTGALASELSALALLGVTVWPARRFAVGALKGRHARS